MCSVTLQGRYLENKAAITDMLINQVTSLTTLSLELVTFTIVIAVLVISNLFLLTTGFGVSHFVKRYNNSVFFLL